MTEVRSEIAANVWQVRIVPGQPVEPGDTLIVLESMKMEIPVESPVRGLVAVVHVQAEAHVEEGEVLAVIEEAHP